MKKLGFTLAEVLITLVIIGVIAAMTVPTLMNNTQGQEYKTAYKKAIASLNQALTMEFAVEGNHAASDHESLNLNNKFYGIAAIMAKRANIINYELGLDTDIPALSTTGRTNITGTPGSDFVMSTADGIVYAFPNIPDDKIKSGCPGDEQATDTAYPSDSCGVGWVDVNGAKGPNKINTDTTVAKPQDRFLFTIYETKVLPGTAQGDPEVAIMYDRKKSGSETPTTPTP